MGHSRPGPRAKSRYTSKARTPNRVHSSPRSLDVSQVGSMLLLLVNVVFSKNTLISTILPIGRIYGYANSASTKVSLVHLPKLWFGNMRLKTEKSESGWLKSGDYWRKRG